MKRKNLSTPSKGKNKPKRKKLQVSLSTGILRNHGKGD